MEEEKKLYPLRFVPVQDDYPWGNEEFKLADLGYRDSFVRDGWLASNTLGEVMDTYLDRVVGDYAYENYGRQFPLGVRYYNVNGKMPLRVCPDDVTAQDRYDFLGKEKLWFVVSAGKDACIYVGFKKDTDASELYGKCLDGSVGDILNAVAPHKGQVFHIPAGTPHAACGNVVIAEIGQSSPLDFCLCNWGEQADPEEFDEALNLVDALDFIDYKAFKYRPADGNKLLDIPQMLVERHILNTQELRVTAGDGFVMYLCLEGSARLDMDVAGAVASFPLFQGEAMLVPAECGGYRLIPADGQCTILEASVPRRPEKDSYIDR